MIQLYSTVDSVLSTLSADVFNVLQVHHTHTHTPPHQDYVDLMSMNHLRTAHHHCH